MNLRGCKHHSGDLTRRVTHFVSQKFFSFAYIALITDTFGDGDQHSAGFKNIYNRNFCSLPDFKVSPKDAHIKLKEVPFFTRIFKNINKRTSDESLESKSKWYE